MHEYKIVAIYSILDPRGVIGNICYEKKIRCYRPKKLTLKIAIPPANRHLLFYVYRHLSWAYC